MADVEQGVKRTQNVWHVDIVQNISKFAAPNEIAFGLRLVNKAAATWFRGYNVIKLSQPSPSHEFRRHWGAPGSMRALTFKRRCEFARLTAMSGCLINLELAIEVAGLMPVFATSREAAAVFLEAAAAAGHVTVCAWLRQRGCPWGSCLLTAARAGHRTVCEWLLEHGCPWDYAAREAAVGGHVELMEWLWQRRPHAARDSVLMIDCFQLLMGAAEGCDLAALARLARDVNGARLIFERQQQGQPLEDVKGYGSHMILEHAVASPTPDWQAKVEWLEAMGWRGVRVRWLPRKCADAVERLLWLRARGHRVDDRALFSAAAHSNDVAGLQRLADPDGGNEAGVFACQFAVNAGNLEALQVMVERGAWVDHVGAIVAFCCGHLGVLQFLHARGATQWWQIHYGDWNLLHLPVVRWAVEALGAEVAARHGMREAAAAVGSVESLSWLRERGCPWSDRTFTAAVFGGSQETIEWLLQNGCPVSADPDTYLPAARRGDLATLRCCLLQLGCPWDRRETFLACAADASVGLPVLRWLVGEAGCDQMDCWEEAVRVAADRRRGLPGYEEVLAWMRAQCRQRQQLAEQREGGSGVPSCE